MTELTKAQLDANIQHMITLSTTGLPDGAVLEYDSRRSVGWRICACQDRLIDPYGSIYRIELPKPAPHPTLLSIVEHGCFPQDWAGWFAVDRDGEVFVFKNAPTEGSIAWMKQGGCTDLVLKLHGIQPSWKQKCWTIQELRDIIKQNGAQQGSIKQNTVELSEADLLCYDIFTGAASEHNERIVTAVLEIGKRIAAQRKEAQS